MARYPLWAATLFHFFMSLLFLAVGISVSLTFNAGDAKEGWLLVLFVSMFLLIGCGGLVWTFICFARWLRFGRCRVRMQTLPGVIGGHFTGEIEVPPTLPFTADVHIELRCEAERSSPGRGSDEHGSTSISVEWSSKIRAGSSDRKFRNRQTFIPFDFVIPYRTNETGVLHDETSNGRNSLGITIRYKWYLHVTSDLEGANLDAKFHVPVFKTEASEETVADPPEAAAGLPLDQYLLVQGEKRRVRIAGALDGCVYVCAAKPIMWRTVLLPGLFGAIFLAVGIGLPVGFLVSGELAGSLHVPKDLLDGLALLPSLLFSIVPFFIAAGFCAFGLLFTFITVQTFIARKTWVSKGIIYQQRTFLGFRLPSIAIPCDRVTSVGTSSSSSSGGKSFSDVSVCFAPKDGRPAPRGLLAAVSGANSILVVTNIPTLRERDELIASLQKDINRNRKTPLSEDGDDGVASV